MQDPSPDELDAWLRAAPMPPVPPAVEQRLAARIAAAQSLAKKDNRKILPPNKLALYQPGYRPMVPGAFTRRPTPVPAIAGAIVVIILLLALFIFHHASRGTGTEYTPTAMSELTSTDLNATFISADGLYSFQYNQENWTNTSVADADFPNGKGLNAQQSAFFFALPATQEIPNSDYPRIMTAFWKTITDKYTGTGLDIAPFTPMPDITVGGNTWTVGHSYASGGGPSAPVAYYALLHNGKTFFITTFSYQKIDVTTYLQPMLATFQFLK